MKHLIVALMVFAFARPVLAQNVFWIENLEGYPGQKSIRTNVMATYRDLPQVGGYFFGLRWDAEVIRMNSFEFSEFVMGFDPDYFIVTLDPNIGMVSAGVIRTFGPDLDWRTFPSTVERAALMTMNFDVAPEAVVGSTHKIEFIKHMAPPPKGFQAGAVATGIVSVRDTYRPEMKNSTLTIAVDPRFVRTDVDGNGEIQLADAVLTLEYLFAGTYTPAILDTADADDNGKVNLADAIGILRYMFHGTGDPPAPFPDPGLDPTPDDL